MITMQTVLNQMTGSETVNALIEFMEKHFDDFPVIRQKYIDAMQALQEALGEPAREEAAAIERQIGSRLLFSGVLGINANLDYFKNPVSNSFLNADAEVYLRESTARRLPEYEAAQEVRDRFFAALTPAQQALHQDVAEYACYLETVGPKLAHYCGYLLGNELLCQIIPGYLPDLVQTLQYRRLLERYFDTCLEWSFF